jgi:hypothetical protein
MRVTTRRHAGRRMSAGPRLHATRRHALVPAYNTGARGLPGRPLTIDDAKVAGGESSPVTSRASFCASR